MDSTSQRRSRRATRRYALLAAILALSLCGCSSLGPGEHANGGPELDLFEFFDGHAQAWGIVQDWRGRVTRQFVASIDGHVAGNRLTLDESFEYADGEQDLRQWHIVREDDGRYRGTANDIIGEASGQATGNAMNWQYDMDIESDGSTYRVHFDDSLWRIDENTLINRADINKFGVTVAQVTLFMRRTRADD